VYEQELEVMKSECCNLYFEPVKRSKDRSDVIGFGSFTTALATEYWIW